MHALRCEFRLPYDNGDPITHVEFQWHRKGSPIDQYLATGGRMPSRRKRELLSYSDCDTVEVLLPTGAGALARAPPWGRGWDRHRGAETNRFSFCLGTGSSPNEMRYNTSGRCCAGRLGRLCGTRTHIHICALSLSHSHKRLGHATPLPHSCRGLQPAQARCKAARAWRAARSIGPQGRR